MVSTPLIRNFVSFTIRRISPVITKYSLPRFYSLQNSTNFPIKGIIATAFTPFKDSSEDLNLSVIPKIATHFKQHGFESVLINGTYAEGTCMTADERMQVADAWAEAIKSTNQKLIVQVGGTNLREIKKLAEHAEKIHADAILCLPHLYYKPSTIEQLTDYLREVYLAAPKTPLLYYHSPDATNVRLNMAKFLRQPNLENRIPSLAGMKFASPNMKECLELTLAAGKRYKVIVANNITVSPCISIGIDTFMPTVINIKPDLVNKIYQHAMKGDFATANVYQEQIARVVDELDKLGKGQATMKAVTRHTTPMDVGPSRKPLHNFETPEGKMMIFKLIESINSF